MLNGKPLAEGEITFTIMGKPPQISAVVAGAYEGQAVPGNNVVQISSYKVGPPDTTGEPSKINIINRKFNYDSKLKADVEDGKDNTFDFEVSK